MKPFGYTLRDKTGALKRGTLQAVDRADALQKIKALGGTPVSVSEDLSDAPRPAWNKRLGAAAAAVAVLAVVLTAWKNFDRKTAERPEAASGLAKKSAPAPAKKPGASVLPLPHGDASADGISASGQPLLPLTRETVKTAPSPVHPPPVHPPPAQTPSAQGPAAAEPPAESEEPAFKTPTEQLIGMLGRPGEEMPPLPLFPDETLEEDFSKALTNVIVVRETDDEAAVARKETVAWVKEYIKEAKKLGWTPAEYIKALEAQRKEEALERNAALKLLEEAGRELPAQASAVRDQLNRELEQKGIIPLELEEPK